MSKYLAIINNTTDGKFYANVVKVNKDGEYICLHGYQGRAFKTLAAAQKSTAKYIEKMS